MASLYNNKISSTYVGLIKTLDSAVINATLRELSDGLGNQTGLFINTSGDFKATGILEFGSLKDTGENITITKFVDEADGIANNDNDTTIPTSAAIIDYVASQVTLEDLDFSGDSGSGSVDLDTQTFAIVGTANEIETSASGQQLQIGLPSSISVNLVGNVTGDLTGNVTGDLTGNITATSVLADGVTATTQSANDNSTKVATTAYVDAQVTAEDLDFAGDSGTGSVDLDSQSLSVTGTTNQVTTSAINQTLNISLPATVHRNLQGDVTGDLTGNVTGNLTGDVTGDVTGDLTGNVTATSVLADGVTATTQTQGDNSTKVATTAYVDAGLGDQDTLAEVLAVGNTTGGTDIAVSANDDITFTDTSKAIFGAGSDLQIYHEGTDSYIKDAGTGNLNINADQLVFKSADNTETKAIFNTNGQVELYYDNSKKLETVSNGVDITGNADVSGQITVGTSDTLLAENTLRFKSSGDAFIDQNTVGQSLYLRTSNAASLDTNAVIITSDGDIDLSGSLTIAQDLTVNGTTTTVNTETLAVEDPLISMAKDNAANSVDIGFYGRYNDGSNRYLGLYADASDTNTFKLFKGTTTEPTTTVDSTATGYALADLDVATLTATSSIAVPSITLDEYITHTGDSDTYFGFPSADNFSVTTGTNTNLAISSSTVTLKHSGTTKLETVAGGISVTGNADISGEVQVGGAGSRFAENNLRFNSAGGAFIDHTITGQSFSFRTSVSSALDTTPLVLNGANATFAGQVSVGNYTIPGDHQFQIANLGQSFARFGLTNSQTGNGSGDGLKFQMENLNSIIKNQENGTLGFGTNGRETDILIDSSGKIGVSNTNPSAFNSLGATAQIVIGDADAVSNITMYSSSSGYGSVSFADSNSSSSSSQYSGLIQYYQVNNSMQFYTAATERMRIDGSGTTKITATKAYGSETATLRVATTPTGTNYSDGAYANIVFGDESIANSHLGEIQVVQLNASASTASDMMFFTNSGGGNTATSERVRITSGGNIGIGTGADVYGDLHLEGGQQDIVLTNSSADGVAGLTISRIIGQARGYGNNGAVMQSIDFETNSSAWYKGDIVFKTNDSDGTNPATSATERMRIDSNGFVTIKNNAGVDSASLTFSNSDIGIGLDQSIGYLNFYSNDSSTSSLGGVGGIAVKSEEAFNTSFTPTYMSFYTHERTNNNGTSLGNVTERMRIDSSGRVGIGGEPTHKLYVRNDVVASSDLDPTAIKLYNNSDGGSAIEFSNGVSANSKISFGVESTGAGTDDTFIAFSTGVNGGLS